MEHPFVRLKPEYTQLLAAMQVRPDHQHLVDTTAAKLLAHKSRYLEVSNETGVPIIFMATSFEREASSNFSLNPAQGWPLSSHSEIVPYNGPFKNWHDAAVAAYHIDGLDRVGAANWTWELMCFYGESFNGFGPRGHGKHTGYLWACTNIYTGGKYLHDGPSGWDPNFYDPQIGIIPVARRMVELDPSLALPPSPYVETPPVSISIGTAPDHPEVDVAWIQKSLNGLGYHLDVDNNYGRQTMRVVADFQRHWRITIDGIAGPETIAALKAAVAAKPAEPAG